MSLPTITVLMSTYNGEKYLRQQLDSILCQQDVEVKVLIRDDGSTDETKCILEEYSQYNENIKVYEAENVGAKQSFLELVNDTDTDTEYYAFCDQDDIWLERKLISAIEKILHYDAERPRLYYSRVKRVGENLEQLSNVFEKHYHTERFGAVLVNRAAPGCTMVWDRCTMKYLRMYRPQIFYMHDSWTLQVCLAVNGVAIYDDNSYILYRQHGSNVIGGLKKMKKSKLQLFVYRVKKFLDFSYDTMQYLNNC